MILRKLKLNTLQQTLTLIFITFGTNMMYYTVDAPLYSHVYSFCLIAAFIYLAFALKDAFTVKNIAAISFIAGLIFITRPVNISVFLLLPFIICRPLSSVWQQMISRKRYLWALLPGLLMPALLFTLYKIATGHFIIYSYGNEGFNFLHPHTLQFLFHYNNGVLPYTPILLIPALLAFTWYRPQHRTLLIGLATTLVITIYIHSSWWCWTYGYSFGARSLLDFAAPFGIIIGISLQQTNQKKYLYLLPVYLLCCVLTTILYHQMSHGGYLGKLPITNYWSALKNIL